MTLLIRHIVKHARARLAALRPAAAPPALRLVPRALAFEPTALERAHALYAGFDTLSADEFFSLAWLDCFARSGRQLLMGHALGLLEGWLSTRQKAASLEIEAEKLARLTRAAGSFAAQLPADELKALAAALQRQIGKVERCKPASASAALLKATTLLETTQVLSDQSQLTRQVSQLLELALPELIGGDGGPLQHSLHDFVAWVSPLLARENLTYSPALRGALDRVGPFLSMLVGADHDYAFESVEKPLQSVHATAPLKLAPQARAARLAAGKAVVIALPQQLTGETVIAVSSHAHHLFTAGLFRHAADDDGAVLDISAQSGAQGQLLQLTMPQAMRTVFLSPQGDDLRVEDHVLTRHGKQWLRLDINPEAKVSVSRNAMQASLAFDRRNLWQLTLRGGRILPQQHGSEIIIETQGKSVNWALKRLARAVPRHPQDTTSELPF
jgi:hypothetical protein